MSGGVYPRAYGGTEDAKAIGWPKVGLSPRVRGNLRAIAMASCNDGLSPRVRGNRRIAAGVYPRAYGGTDAGTLMKRSIPAGRRRIPRVYPRWGNLVRSIPARTGEPTPPLIGLRSRLSPRVRGNLCAHRSNCSGSIPARTGEPKCPLVISAVGLSPRVRGNQCRPETIALEEQEGLSPRVRGNP